METYKQSQKEMARPYRIAVLKALLILTIVGATLFSILNIINDNYPLALVELLMGGYSVFLFWAIGRTQYPERWIIAFLIPFFTAMMFAMYTPRATIFVYGWVLLIPIVSHLLIGRRLGLLLSLTFMTIAGSIFLFKHHNQPDMMQALPIANMALISMCILAFSHVYEVTRERTERQLLEVAETDPLTGLANRARFSDIFEREKKRAHRYSLPMTVLVLDLDHFKDVNDRHGHEVGDHALQHVTRIFRDSLRATDLPARLGGEEFGILLTDTTSEQGLQVAEKIRATLAGSPLKVNDEMIHLTLSGGIAVLGADGESLRELVAKADKRLYEAKKEGRNRVVPPSPDHLSAATEQY